MDICITCRCSRILNLVLTPADAGVLVYMALGLHARTLELRRLKSQAIWRLGYKGSRLANPELLKGRD